MKQTRFEREVTLCLDHVVEEVTKLNKYVKEGEEFILLAEKTPLPILVALWQKKAQEQYTEVDRNYCYFLYVLHDFDNEGRWSADKRCTGLAVDICKRIQEVTSLYYLCISNLYRLRGEFRNKLDMKKVSEALEWKLVPFRDTMVLCQQCHEKTSWHYGQLYCHNCQIPVVIQDSDQGNLDL